MLRTARKTFLWLLLAIPACAVATDINEIERLDGPAERVDAYEALLGEHPDSMEILFKLGNAYYDLEMVDEAIRRYERSFRAGGGLPVVVNLTYVLAEMNRRDDADRVFREFLEKTPLDPLGHAYYADFLGEGAEIAAEVDQARALTQRSADEYRRALEIHSGCVEARFGLGVLFARAGIFEEAIREWRRAMNDDPRHRLVSRLRTNISDAERRLGR